ncbi:MAG: hypothetical protein GY841_08450 [FCB group bacterium]|nr:hypothetical protein [FCB group bacterium]
MKRTTLFSTLFLIVFGLTMGTTFIFNDQAEANLPCPGGCTLHLDCTTLHSKICTEQAHKVIGYYYYHCDEIPGRVCLEETPPSTCCLEAIALPTPVFD